MNGLNFDKNRQQLKNMVVEELGRKFGDEVRVFRNVRCPDCFNPQTFYTFPVVVLTKEDVFPFLELKGDLLSSNRTSALETVDYKLRVFSNHFRVRNSFEQGFVFCCNDKLSEASEALSESSRMFLYQGLSASEPVFCELGVAESVDVITQATILKGETFDELGYEALSAQLSKASTGRFKQTEKPTIYFSKNSERAFYLALFGGMFGAHRFYLGMFGTGFLYVLTLGLLGVGWFFDCLEILLGVWKKKGKKLSPLPNKKKHFIEMLVIFGVFLTLLFIFSKF